MWTPLYFLSGILEGMWIGVGACRDSQLTITLGDRMVGFSRFIITLGDRKIVFSHYARPVNQIKPQYLYLGCCGKVDISTIVRLPSLLFYMSACDSPQSLQGLVPHGKVPLIRWCWAIMSSQAIDEIQYRG